MKISSEQITFVQKCFKILQTPGHYPDGNKVISTFKSVYAKEIKNKVKPYYRSLSPNCGTCIKFCVFTLKNDLEEIGILDVKGDYTK